LPTETLEVDGQALIRDFRAHLESTNSAEAATLEITSDGGPAAEEARLTACAELRVEWKTVQKPLAYAENVRVLFARLRALRPDCTARDVRRCYNRCSYNFAATEAALRLS
jgi:hypothetical protein